MKKLLLLLVVLTCTSPLFAQVGINTTEPTATLDIDGNLRVRGMKDLQQEIVATRILGVDEDGNFVEVEVEDNIVLEDNKLKLVDKFELICDDFSVDVIIVHNLKLLILPGEPNDKKTIIRITNGSGDLEISGIEPAQNGQKIKLYPTSGDIVLSVNDTASLPGNRILAHNNGNVTVRQYQMVELMYDGIEGGWIIMSRH